MRAESDTPAKIESKCKTSFAPSKTATRPSTTRWPAPTSLPTTSAWLSSPRSARPWSRSSASRAASMSSTSRSPKRGRCRTTPTPRSHAWRVKSWRRWNLSTSSSRSTCAWPCCRRTPVTIATSSSRSAPGPVAKRPRCSPQSSTACTAVTPSSAAGRSKSLSASESEKGGFKEIVFELHGKGAYSRLKFESGGHRVQRVPATEAQGRIHTSTATVAVLPQAEEIELEINENDVRTDIYHSGGAGGQNVNKVVDCGASDAHPHRHRRPVPGRALSAQEPRQGNERAASAPSAGQRRRAGRR